MRGGRPELWQECEEWLTSAAVLDANVRLAKPADLAAILRDGILLCHLALRLKPESIDRSQIFLHSNAHQFSQFISTNNISLFVRACREHFALEESDIFQEDDLYDLRDFPRVLRTLALLSKTPHAAQRGLRPFPGQYSPHTSSHHDAFENDAVYCNLREEVEQAVEECQYDVVGNYRKAEVMHNEELYDSIVTKPAYSKTDAMLSKYDEYKPETKRQFAIKELLDTETNYCAALRMIIENFYNKLRHILPADDLETVFINIHSIYSTHKDFLKKLRQAVLFTLGLDKPKDGEPNVRISDVFIEFKMGFVAYGRYCSLLNASRAKIDEIERTRPSERQRIAEISKEANDGKIRLQDLLSVPMQRILKYHLMLKSLVDTTPFEDPDRSSLEEAHEAMNDINSYINEVKRDHESIEIIETVERSVAAKRPARFTEYGRLVIDGVVKLVDPEENSNRPKPRYVFFFEKVIMVCKQRANNAYDYKRAYMLQEFEVSEAEPESAYKTNTIGRKLTASFFDNTSLTLNKRNLKVGDQALQIVMQFKSLQQRDQWKKGLKEAIEKVDPPEAKAKGHQLTYFTYTLAATCTLCTKLLAGKFYQGYRCYNCRRDFHRECAGLQECTSRASSSRISSTLPITRRIQNGDADHGLVKPHDRVVARQSIQSPDHNVLSFDAGDIIEVVHVNNPASFIGRLASSPGKSGLVAVDSVHKPGTLRPPLPTPNRTSQNSLPDMNGDRPVSLVSSRIIDFTTDVADEMADQPWYFGDMERREAEEKLVNTDTGTFLVRRSNHHDQFVISISVRSTAKHIKIYRDEHVFYLHDGKMFNSIIDLIKYYRRNNLSEGFENLDTVLKGTPLRQVEYRVVHQFERGDAQKYLTIRPGDIVRVIDTSGEHNGWWKGVIEGRGTGFFPITYVERTSQSDIESLTGTSEANDPPTDISLSEHIEPPPAQTATRELLPPPGIPC